MTIDLYAKDDRLSFQTRSHVNSGSSRYYTFRVTFSGEGWSSVGESVFLTFPESGEMVMLALDMGDARRDMTGTATVPEHLIKKPGRIAVGVAGVLYAEDAEPIVVTTNLVYLDIAPGAGAAADFEFMGEPLYYGLIKGDDITGHTADELKAMLRSMTPIYQKSGDVSVTFAVNREGYNLGFAYPISYGACREAEDANGFKLFGLPASSGDWGLKQWNLSVEPISYNLLVTRNVISKGENIAINYKFR